MSNSQITSAQNETASSPYTGNLTINVTSTQGLLPVRNASVTIRLTGDPDSVVETASTNESGQTQNITLPAPNPNYSVEPNQPMPYSEYTITVSAPGYESVTVSGTEILPDVTAVQPISMRPVALGGSQSPIVIPDHTLYGEYPAKIPEEEIKPMNESGEIVLSRVVLPEYIVVHDGVPQDSTAPDYYVRYADYIKNVVSSEIYATWPESTIYANTLAIMSFTLNRVYTEWSWNQ